MIVFPMLRCLTSILCKAILLLYLKLWRQCECERSLGSNAVQAAFPN